MTSERPARVAVVIPALNEAASIGLVIGGLDRARVERIVVCDNGSADDTATVAALAGAVVVTEPRRGYGRACLAALENLRADPPDVVAFIDADRSDYPDDMPQLLDTIARGADLVIGSRVRLASPGALLPQARFGNALSTWLIRMRWGVRFTDLGPFRAATWDALQRIDMRDKNFGWTVEMQAKAARLGLRCEEVDVRYRPRHGGKSKVTGTIRGTILAGAKILYVIAREFLRR